MKAIVIILLVAVVLVVLYLWMIMPRIFGRPNTKPFEGVLYAHRGLHNNETEAPENSLAAFQKAVEAGFGIELDIQLTKDGVPVVFHDATLKRMCRADGKICDFTYKELQQFCLGKSKERIPKLEEVLALVDGQVPLIVEFKGENLDLSLCAAADKLLRNYKGTYCMESFNPLMVGWYRKKRPEILRGQLSEKFFADGKKTLLNFVLENLLLNFYAKPDFIAYNCKNYDALSRRICCGIYGATAVAWTIQSNEQLEGMRKYFDLFIFDSFHPEGV